MAESRNGPNSDRGRGAGLEQGVPRPLIADCSEPDPARRSGAGRVGLTAGASAPEGMVLGAPCRHAGGAGAVEVAAMDGIRENMGFCLTPELRAPSEPTLAQPAE
ncbi:hypothetical protein [Roseomonas indoligenes]|uniref:Uncharacterized protein n=1 Tax=Roseomonas indoligenes TaxID=2820811 RepID=A0A940MVI0_9PROT|nr:hypothetical protein [Pararoseomonas indoligenes]MBP0491730.1 hypothetical protein [Pararoseomonas indoligenes]